MAKVMLIDATHPEETRVAVADGRKLEEFDVEVASRRPLKGNIYLAKVTRVEPSLQAAFVEYGGNRHGFLAFSEIHPDYYRIPVADRERLLREAARDDDDEDDVVEHRPRAQFDDHDEDDGDAMAAAESSATEASFEDSPSDAGAAVAPSDDGGSDNIWQHASETRSTSIAHGEEARPEAGAAIAPVEGPGQSENNSSAPPPRAPTSWFRPGSSPRAAPAAPRSKPHASNCAARRSTTSPRPRPPRRPAASMPLMTAMPWPPAPRMSCRPNRRPKAATAMPNCPAPTEAELVEVQTTAEVVDVIGGEEPAQQDDPEVDEEQARRRRQRNLRRYKIQEVIKRRQILLVQVTKEERGNKGAALTTYLSLAGRYCVLMPNTDRGGGISRRITSVNDRKRLKSIIDDLDVPDGMAVIVRTAGMERTKPEIRRDFEYLLRLWDEIREVTLKSTAPALIYEEANLIKRSIRDLYTRDIDDIMVEGEEGYRAARDFMRTLMPSHTAPGAGLSRPVAARCSSATRSRARSRRSTSRWCICAPAATSCSTRPRRWSRSTSIPAARPASATSKRRRCAPTSRRRRKSRASCGCATWPASSSSTSSTWRRTATTRRSSAASRRR